MCKDITTRHHNNSGVYAREMHLPKDWKAESHKHTFDHMSILAQGEVIVTVNGKETIHKAPAVMTIKAGLVHGILAIEDSVWFCIHAAENFEIEKINIGKDI